MNRLLIPLVLLSAWVDLSYAVSIGRKQGCTVSIYDDLKDPQVLLLKAGDGNVNDMYHWPTDDEGKVVFKENDVILATCPGGVLRINGASTKYESAEAVCSGGSFDILDKTVAFKSITCSKLPFHTARYTKRACLGRYKEIEVGFLLENDKFIKHITVCFDDQLQNTVYAEFNMTRFIDGFQSDYPRPDFIQDNFYNVGSRKVDTLYTRKTQRNTINPLLGLPSSSTKYISQSDDFFLARGHLAAKADFVYGAQQRFTFHYINVAPQWQTFNGKNWNSLEQDVRSFVARHDSDVTVITGTHGIATLPHESSNKDVELYLYVDGKKKGLPVPKFFWRVLYDAKSKAGIAFVGLNNPYNENPKEETICTNICDRIDWLHWNQKNATYGYSYCCEVDDLRKAGVKMPEFNVEGILLK